MVAQVKRVTILGAGQMGSGAAAVFGQEVPVFLLNRAPISKAQTGLQAAINMARSNSLRFSISPGTFEDDLERCVQESDLVLDTLGEDAALKTRYFKLVDQYRRPGTIVATGSSGLSVAGLCQRLSPDFRKHFLCIHLFNPPTRLTAVELVPGPDTLPDVMEYTARLMEKTFRRAVVYARDMPGYAGNRVGFKVLNEVAQMVPQYGVAMLDYMFGSYTGRLLPPLATIDLVGWDVHKSLVDNIYQTTKDEARDAFRLPGYMEERVQAGYLGDKTPNKGGFYRKVQGSMFVLDMETGEYVAPLQPKIEYIEEVKRHIRYGNYKEAIRKLMCSEAPEADIVRRGLLGYISYAGMRNGEISDMQGINRVMGAGFNWIPPDALVDLIGIEETQRLLRQEGFVIPPHLATADGRLYQEDDDVGRYLAGR